MFLKKEGKVKVSFNWEKLKGALKRWEFWAGAISIALTVAVIIAVVFYWEDVQKLQRFGYLGSFIISVLGGITILAPVPNTPVVFALGAVMKPEFAPYLGPVFVGAAAGLGQTVAAGIIYVMGYSGGTPIVNRESGRFQAVYRRLVGWMERRGSLILFLLSAVINPFFYPAALTAGALRFGIKRYFLICLAGKTINGITVAAAGYWGLGSILRALGVSI